MLPLEETMSVPIKPEFETYIEKAEAMWLTSVRADGTPQPTPIWFIRDADGSFIIYSMPDAQKVKNIRQHPKVTLNFNIDPGAEYYIVLTGEARVDETIPPSNQIPAYQTKYAALMPPINFTPDTLAATFSLPLRVVISGSRGSLPE
jgi:PPOX class probable F420-dependent enzyme